MPIFRLKEDIRSLRRKIRRLEERVSELEKAKEEQTDDKMKDDKMKLVEHLKDTDVQAVLTTLARAFFSEVEIKNSSRTGKKTSKCAGDPRPPIDQSKFNEMERLVILKTKISRDVFIKKFENFQKTLRQK